MKKRKLMNILVLMLCALSVILGIVLFRDRNYNLISMLLALLACIPFFFTFERGKIQTRKLVLIAVMIALTVVSRLVFFAIPGFKPVTAVVIITGMYFGAETGFLTGSLSALISNFFYGQGPWTPFQMFVWGLIGFGAGLLAKLLYKNRGLLFTYGGLSGVGFSLIMDIWTTISLDGTFNLLHYLAAVATSLPFVGMYIISNIVFLWALERPIGQKLERIKIKYGI